MKTFIGVKVISAEPMSYSTFETAYRPNLPREDKDDQPGYHVVYPNPKGDYHSWSPASVFEQAYREINDGEVNLIYNNFV